ncbi:LysM peptidoglycan-binding domain-containing protein [Marinicrinis sediminis]|uniref:LysM peptidoglycan-binding domain-containing protein n=1 Tax=Marinicrinis sediminis TaxID=1652465 RepID=A0ABW5R7E0_9BACL
MTGDPKGLRFDIYERVQLQQQLDGLEQIEEIELLPKIEVMSQAEQAVLKGHLLLSGAYTVSENRSLQKLQHEIPVEITLPMSRITSLDELKVDIDHFDIDLVNPRSLSVTGVLSLDGIEMLRTSEADEVWKETEREYSRAGDQAEAQTSALSNADQVSNEEDQAALRGEKLPANQDTPSIGQQVEEKPPAKKPEKKEEPKQEAKKEMPKQAPAKKDDNKPDSVMEKGKEKAPANEQSEVMNEAAEKFNKAMQEANEMNQPNPMLNEEAAEQEQVEPQPEKGKKMKIAFGSKKEEAAEVTEEVPEKKGLMKGLKSLIHREDQPFDEQGQEEQDAAADDIQAGNASTEDESSSGAAWKSLFLSQRQEQDEFKRMRLCIVQKQDTIDTIAERYEMNPRELLLYNRLEQDHIEEGQILYIPSLG